MSDKEPNKAVIEDVGSFPELDGANVSWWGFSISHSRLRLLASSASGFAEIYFSFVRYVDCPTTMHSARLRRASESDTESIRELLPPDERDLLKQKDLFLINSDEGKSFVWAQQAGFAWIPEPNNVYLEELEANALWVGGPSLKEV